MGRLFCILDMLHSHFETNVERALNNGTMLPSV
jgi:hypothetical protein